MIIKFKYSTTHICVIRGLSTSTYLFQVFELPEDEQESETNFYSLMFLVLGGASGFCLLFQVHKYIIWIFK